MVSYRPCVAYSFVPYPLPGPLSSFSPRIYSIFCLANYPRSLLRPWSHNPDTSPTSMIVPSFSGPRRRGHSHPFLHRLKGNFVMVQSFQRTRLHTKLSTLSQWPQADLSHTSTASSVAPSCVATPSFCSAKARSYLIPDVLCVITYMVYHPTAPISACYTSNRYLWTQPSHRVNYPSCLSIRSSSSPWAAATSHTQMCPSLIGLL